MACFGRMRRVAIIGGGPAGLSMADQLAAINARGPAFSVTLFERRTAFGGVWTYDADPGDCDVRFDRHGRAHALWGGRKDGDDSGRFCPPGPMYDGLRTNLPCDIMTYRSHPYPPQTPLFPSRATVEKYIVDFANTLEPIDTRLATAVKSVQRISHDPAAASQSIGAGSKWAIRSIDTTTGKERDEEFDCVVLASGRCNTPSIPFVKGLWDFRGTVMHSAWWRSPVPFAGRTVLVVGNSSSGSDIARELAGYILRSLPEGDTATRNYMARCDHDPPRILHSYEKFDAPPPLDYDPRSTDSPDWAKRITVVPRIDHIEPTQEGGSKIVFEDGETRDDVDTIIFGTGYAYDFPYLDQQAAPFDNRPLIPRSPSIPPQQVGGEIYEPPFRTSSKLTNLDDWSLFYAADASICVLGAPIRIVPMPLTHVQARIVAAAWSGHIDPHPHSALPSLDPSIPSTDPDRWTSSSTAPKQGANLTTDLGYPSDTAYQNALLALLPTDLAQQGDDEETQVPETQSNQPVLAKSEGWSIMPTFRNQRRQDTKRLRRLLLGY